MNTNVFIGFIFILDDTNYIFGGYIINLCSINHFLS